MKGNKRFKSSMRFRNRENPDDFICLSKVMKEIAGETPVRFVIIDKADNEIEIEVSSGGYRIAGVERTDEDARVFISRNRKDFESFFMEAAARNGARSSIMQKIYMAKLADIAGKNSVPAKIRFSGDRGDTILEVSREDDEAVFRLDGKVISRRQAYDYISARYTDFLIAYKGAVKGTEKISADDKKKEERRKEKRAAVGIKSEMHNGKLEMNIDHLLGGEKQKENSRRHMKASDRMPLSEDFFKQKRHGYVPSDE